MMMKMKMLLGMMTGAVRCSVAVCCLFGVLCPFAGSANAATKTWTSNAAGSGSWSLADNWDLDIAPVAGDTLIFTIPVAGGTRTTTNDFPANTQFNAITVNANAFTLSGNAINLGGNFAFTVGLASSTCTVSLDTVLLQNTDISVTAAGSGTQPLLTWNGIISGNFGITKSGGGSTRWQMNAKTYNGDTTISAGTLELNAANVLPFGAGKGNLLVNSGAFVNFVTGATHNINGLSDGAGGGGTIWSNSSSGTKILILGNNNADGSFSGVISQTIGAIAVTKNGTGTQTLSGQLSYTGATTVNGGTLNLNNPTSSIGTSAVSLAGKSIVNFASTGALTTTGQINTNTGATDATVINHTQGTLAAGDTFLGNTSGSYSSYLLSGGALNVTNLRVGSAASGAAGTYGYFRQSGGTVTIPSTGLVTVNRGTNTTSVLHITGGTLNAGGNNMNLGFSANGTGVLTVSGGLVIENNQIVTGQNASTGIVNLNGGTVRPNFFTNSSTGFINFNGGTVQPGAANANFLGGLDANVYSGGAKIDNNGLDITIADALKATGGTTGVASIPVATGGSGYIAPPVVTFTGGGGTGATAVANLTGGVVTSITITSAGTGYTSAPTVALAGGGPTTPATLGAVTTGLNADDGGLTKSGAGTLTLTGTNTYTGATTISSGTLQLGDGTTNGNIANSSSIVDNAALVYNRTAGNTFTYANPITGTGSVTKIGAGTQLLTGANTYSGGTSVTGGILGGTGTLGGSTSFASTTTHTPGVSGPGLQRVNGNYALNTGSTLAADITSSVAGTGYDQVGVTGTVTLGGTLNVVVPASYVPVAGSVYTLINNDGTGDAVSGTFSGVPQGGLINSVDGRVTFVVSYAGGDGNDVILTVSSTRSNSAVISEFRLSGPGTNGAGDPTDEFIEIYNNTNASLDITNWTVTAGAGTPVTLAGSIPARGHYLVVGTGYSLGTYAQGDQSLPAASDIALTAALTLKSAAGDVLDVVNDSALLVPASGGESKQYSFGRRLESGVAQDTGTDTNDFNLVDTSSASSTVNGTGFGPMTGARLGAPGPQNRFSPIQNNLGIALSSINIPGNGLAGTAVIPEARYVSKNSTIDPKGRLSLRYNIKNKSTTTTVTTMRFRIVAITAGTSSTAGVADIRAISSGGVRYYASNGTTILQAAQPLVLEKPSLPTEAPLTATSGSTGKGGGLNSSWTVAIPGGLAPGASVGVEFLFGIVTDGQYRVAVDTELLP
ncbi:adhesin BmaC autotransporter [Abditibacteriota bacterium]|nr:adhesin BmaC autotransporter [Abditibacteriota bacterium]